MCLPSRRERADSLHKCDTLACLYARLLSCCGYPYNQPNNACLARKSTPGVRKGYTLSTKLHYYYAHALHQSTRPQYKACMIQCGCVNTAGKSACPCRNSQSSVCAALWYLSVHLTNKLLTQPRHAGTQARHVLIHKHAVCSSSTTRGCKRSDTARPGWPFAHCARQLILHRAGGAHAHAKHAVSLRTPHPALLRRARVVSTQ